MRTTTRLAWLGALVLACAIAGCGDDDDDTPVDSSVLTPDGRVVDSGSTVDARVCVDPRPGVSTAAFCAEYATTCGFAIANGYTSMADCTTRYGGFTAARQGCAAYHVCNADVTGLKTLHCPHAAGNNGFCGP